MANLSEEQYEALREMIKICRETRQMMQSWRDEDRAKTIAKSYPSVEVAVNPKPFTSGSLISSLPSNKPSNPPDRAQKPRPSPPIILTTPSISPQPPDPPNRYIPMAEEGSRQEEVSPYHLPVFDGTSLDCWIMEVERFFWLGQYGDEEKLDIISLSLEEAALKWFKKHRREFTDWTYFKRKVIARFGMSKSSSPPEVLSEKKLKDDEASAEKGQNSFLGDFKNSSTEPLALALTDMIQDEESSPEKKSMLQQESHQLETFLFPQMQVRYWDPKKSNALNRKKSNETLFLEDEQEDGHDQKELMKVTSSWNYRLWEPGGVSTAHGKRKWLEKVYKRYGALWLLQKLHKMGLDWVKYHGREMEFSWFKKLHVLSVLMSLQKNPEMVILMEKKTQDCRMNAELKIQKFAQEKEIVGGLTIYEVAETLEKLTSFKTTECAYRLFDKNVQKGRREKQQSMQRKVLKSWKFKFKSMSEAYKLTGLLDIDCCFYGNGFCNYTHGDLFVGVKLHTGVINLLILLLGHIMRSKSTRHLPYQVLAAQDMLVTEYYLLVESELVEAEVTIMNMWLSKLGGKMITCFDEHKDMESEFVLSGMSLNEDAHSLSYLVNDYGDRHVMNLGIVGFQSTSLKLIYGSMPRPPKFSNTLQCYKVFRVAYDFEFGSWLLKLQKIMSCIYQRLADSWTSSFQLLYLAESLAHNSFDELRAYEVFHPRRPPELLCCKEGEESSGIGSVSAKRLLRKMKQIDELFPIIS